MRGEERRWQERGGEERGGEEMREWIVGRVSKIGRKEKGQK